MSNINLEWHNGHKLWKKNTIPPHVLVMTATPIPRTLALTAYGDLDYSVMDELPPGRQPIHTVHRYEYARPQVMDFIKEEVAKGRQAYIIYPLIEESIKLDYENLMKGYEEVKAFFPEPKYWISMVHGRQMPEPKETNMQRFVNRRYSNNGKHHCNRSGGKCAQCLGNGN